MTRQSRAQYGFKKDGTLRNAFKYDWSSVKWNKTDPPIFTIKDIVGILADRFSENFYLLPDTIKSYFYGGRWPIDFIIKSSGQAIYGMSSKNLDKVIAVFEKNCVFSLTHQLRLIDGDEANKKVSRVKVQVNYTPIDELTILKEGFTTSQASGYIKDTYGLIVPHESVRSLCTVKNNPIPHSTRQGGRKHDFIYIVHKQNLDEYAEAVKALNKEKKEKEKQSEVSQQDKTNNVESNNKWKATIELRLTDLRHKVEELRELVLSEFTNTNARVDEVNKNVVLQSSWLHEQFPNEFKEEAM